MSWLTKAKYLGIVNLKERKFYLGSWFQRGIVGLRRCFQAWGETDQHSSQHRIEQTCSLHGGQKIKAREIDKAPISLKGDSTNDLTSSL